MSNIVAGIGRGQLEVLDEWVRLRRKVNAWYKDIFTHVAGITFLEEPSPEYFSNFWLTTILIDPDIAPFTSNDLKESFEKDNIESRPLWKPMHLQPVFEKHPAYVNGVSENLFETGLCLPSGSNLGEQDRQRIERVISQCIKGAIE